MSNDGPDATELRKIISDCVNGKQRKRALKLLNNLISDVEDARIHGLYEASGVAHDYSGSAEDAINELIEEAEAEE